MANQQTCIRGFPLLDSFPYPALIRSYIIFKFIMKGDFNYRLS